MINQFPHHFLSVPLPALSHLELSLGGSVAKAATELLNSMDSDTCYEVGPLQEALEAWSMGKPVADAQELFKTWYRSTQTHGRQWYNGATGKVEPLSEIPDLFAFDKRGDYARDDVQKAWEAFSAALSLTHGEASIDLRRDLEGLRAQVDALQDPEVVLVNMLRGNIAKLSARSISKLYGDVINGDEAQLAEIARLRALLAEETLRADTAEKDLESARDWIGGAEELMSELRNEVDDGHQARIDEFVEG